MYHTQLDKEERKVYFCYTYEYITFSCKSLAENISLKLSPPYRKIQPENLRHEIRFKSNQLHAGGSFLKSQSRNSPIPLSRNFCNMSLDVQSAIHFESEKDFYHSLWEHKGDSWKKNPSKCCIAQNITWSVRDLISELYSSDFPLSSSA